MHLNSFCNTFSTNTSKHNIHTSVSLRISSFSANKSQIVLHPFSKYVYLTFQIDTYSQYQSYSYPTYYILYADGGATHCFLTQGSHSIVLSDKSASASAHSFDPFHCHHLKIFHL